MLIIPRRDIITSVNDLPSIKRAKRTIVIGNIQNSLHHPQEMFLINQSDEIGGERTSVFVGRSHEMRSRVQYFYTGVFLTPVFIDPIAGKIQASQALVKMNATGYSFIMNGCQRYRHTEEEANTDFQVYLCGGGFEPIYPSKEEFSVPNPRYYTESHQHFAGEERENFTEKLVGYTNKSDYVVEFRSLVDENTTIIACSFDSASWSDAYGSPAGGLGGFDNHFGAGALQNVMIFIAAVQHSVNMNLVDKMLLTIDTEEGFNIFDYESILAPFGKDRKKTQVFQELMATIEDSFQKLREAFIRPVRVNMAFIQGSVKLNVVPRRNDIQIVKERTRSQSDIMFLDFDTYLK